MGIITCYARLTRPQLEELSASPEPARVLYKTPPPGSERIDLDQAAEVIAWLLSPNKRAEQRRAADMLAERARSNPVANAPKPGQRDALLDIIQGRVPPTKFAEAPTPAPPDALRDAIEGRGERREPRVQMGLGIACVFEPAEVREYAQALPGVDEAALRASLDFALMDTLNFPVGDWQEEGESTFTDYILPAFLRLQAFYANATAAEQYVLVWQS